MVDVVVVIVLAMMSIVIIPVVYFEVIDTTEKDRLINELRESCEIQSFHELNFARCHSVGVRPW